MVKVLTEPQRIVIAEQFNFYCRCQGEGESVGDFVAELRRLASSCEFGDFLDDALRDRLVCGLSNETAQRRLFTEASGGVNRRPALVAEVCVNGSWISMEVDMGAAVSIISERTYRRYLHSVKLKKALKTPLVVVGEV